MGSILYNKIALTAKILSQTSSALLTIQGVNARSIITTRITSKPLGEEVIFTLHLKYPNEIISFDYTAVFMRSKLSLDNDTHFDIVMDTIVHNILTTIYGIK